MDMKNSVDGLIRRLDTSRKESLSLKTLRKNLQNSSAKRKKRMKKHRIVGKVTTKGVQVMGISSKKERNRGNILSNNG